MAQPIWKDYYVTLGTSSYVDYSVFINSVAVYSGRAYKRPGASNVKVRVNDIIANYLAPAPPTFTGDEVQDLALVYAEVKVGGVNKDAKYFYGDWSYQDGFGYDSLGMSFPIDHRIDLRQRLLFSDQGYENGAEIDPEAVIIYERPRGDFRAIEFNRDFLIGGAYANYQLYGSICAGLRQFCLDLSGESFVGMEYLELEGHRWKVANTCRDYVLHYINAYGGWDSFLVGGNGKQTDSIKHYEKRIEYSNASHLNRGRENYVNELTRKFTLHTGMLTDDESSRMHHLLNSPCVYLEILATRDIHPVILTGKTNEYKTYRNNGCRLIQYTIEAELAQDRLRR